MKRTARFAAVVLSAGLLLPAASLLAQGPPPPPQGYGYGQGPGPGGPGGWDAPPSNFTRDVQRNAFHDGLDGARKDFENRRPPNVMNRDEYRNYRGPERRVYRQAFNAGYQAFWNHQGPRGPRPY